MVNDYTPSWYSLEWFSPTVLFESFEWANKIFLYLLPLAVIAFIARIVLQNITNQKLPVAVSRKELKSSQLHILRFVPDLLLLLTLLLLFVSLEPQGVGACLGLRFNGRLYQGERILYHLDFTGRQSFRRGA